MLRTMFLPSPRLPPVTIATRPSATLSCVCASCASILAPYLPAFRGGIANRDNNIITSVIAQGLITKLCYRVYHERDSVYRDERDNGEQGGRHEEQDRTGCREAPSRGGAGGGIDAGGRRSRGG